MRDNVAPGPLQGSPSQATSGFPIAIAGSDLQFRTFALADPVPTGRQIIEAFTRSDPSDFIVLQQLENGMLEELRLDETTDLIGAGVERFIVVESDRSFRLLIEGKRQEWPCEIITGATIKKLAGVAHSDADVFLEQKDGPDRGIEDDELVSLAGNGVESFRLHPAQRLVEICVNNRAVKIEKGVRTGLEIKQAAKDQGLPIQLDFVLSLEEANGQSRTIGNTDKVRVRKGMKFICIADDDNS